MTPKLLNKRIATPSELVNAVYIGRPSKWGNPFAIGQSYGGRVMSREDVIEQHRDWLLHSDQGVALQSQLHELRGRSLVCWCVPSACHGALLLELANAPQKETA